MSRVKKELSVIKADFYRKVIIQILLNYNKYLHTTKVIRVRNVQTCNIKPKPWSHISSPGSGLFALAPELEFFNSKLNTFSWILDVESQVLDPWSWFLDPNLWVQSPWSRILVLCPFRIIKKVWQFLQSVTESFYKVWRVLKKVTGIVKCVRKVFQRLSGITKCDQKL